jgi:hypothetical protein
MIDIAMREDQRARGKTPDLSLCPFDILNGMQLKDQGTTRCDINTFFNESMPIVQPEGLAQRGGGRQHMIVIWKIENRL